MKKMEAVLKRIGALVLSAMLLAGSVPEAALAAMQESALRARESRTTAGEVDSRRQTRSAPNVDTRGTSPSFAASRTRSSPARKPPAPMRAAAPDGTFLLLPVSELREL